MGDRCCPKCGRDYSSDPYWTSRLRTHLARKNPCDRDPSTKFIREKRVSQESSVVCDIVPLDSVTWDSVIPKKSNKDTVPFLFQTVFSDPSNVCFVQPNKSKNEILVKVSRGTPVRQVTLNEFIKLFVNHVFIKKMYGVLCEKNFVFQSWLTRNCVDGVHWYGTVPDGSWYKNGYGVRVRNKPEFLTCMKLAVKNFLNTQPNKAHLKNMLLQL
jgi:hypothetical protein